jgi:hypothetical protein
MKRRHDHFAGLLLAAIVFLTPVAYVGGYFGLGQFTAAYKYEDTWVRRSFPSKGLAIVFQPLARVESWATGWDVQAVEAKQHGE